MNKVIGMFAISGDCSGAPENFLWLLPSRQVVSLKGPQQLAIFYGHSEEKTKDRRKRDVFVLQRPGFGTDVFIFAGGVAILYMVLICYTVILKFCFCCVFSCSTSKLLAVWMGFFLEASMSPLQDQTGPTKDKEQDAVNWYYDTVCLRRLVSIETPMCFFFFLHCCVRKLCCDALVMRNPFFVWYLHAGLQQINLETSKRQLEIKPTIHLDRLTAFCCECSRTILAAKFAKTLKGQVRRLMFKKFKTRVRKVKRKKNFNSFMAIPGPNLWEVWSCATCNFWERDMYFRGTCIPTSIYTWSNMFM